MVLIPENDADFGGLERKGIRIDNAEVGCCLKCGKTILLIQTGEGSSLNWTYRGCNCHDPTFDPIDFGSTVVTWDEQLA